MNNKYEIKIEAPLVRAGITITTEVSENYVVPVTHKVLDLVREINIIKEREQRQKDTE